MVRRKRRPHPNPPPCVGEGIFSDYAYLPVSSPTISGAKSRAICFTSSTERTAKGLGMTTMRAPGMPSEVTLALAARVKELVMTLTEGMPRDSVITVSWRPHAVQDPQSDMPCITASHSLISSSRVSSAQGALKLNLLR